MHAHKFTKTGKLQYHFLIIVNIKFVRIIAIKASKRTKTLCFHGYTAGT